MVSPPSSEQKALRKRLATVIRKPYNKVCCDCPEKSTLASILEPPDDAPLGSIALVAFVCYNCASVHKQLGSDIARVRNVTLEDCKYSKQARVASKDMPRTIGKITLTHLYFVLSYVTGDAEEVEAAERSGNKKVNAIYEANLKEGTASGVMVKPLGGAHNASRQRYVKEKYAKRTYYSKVKHYKHVERDHGEPSSPTKSPGRRQSLLVFLKNRDGGDKSDLGFGDNKSTAEGTLTTAPESKDSRSVFQFATKKLEHSPISAAGHTVIPTSTGFLRRASFTPFSKNGTKAVAPPPPPPPNMSPDPFHGSKGSFGSGSKGSFGSKGSLGSSRDGFDSGKSSSEGRRSSARSRKSKKSVGDSDDSQQWQTDFSTQGGGPDQHSFVMGSAKRLDTTLNTYEDKIPPTPAMEHSINNEEFHQSIPTTPMQAKRPIMTPKSMPSPINSRITLYSSKSKGTRGRSSSRTRADGTKSDETRPSTPTRRERRAATGESNGSTSRRGRSQSTRRTERSIAVEPKEDSTSGRDHRRRSSRESGSERKSTSSRARSTESRSRDPSKKSSSGSGGSTVPSSPRRHRHRSASRQARSASQDPSAPSTKEKSRRHRSPSNVARTSKSTGESRTGRSSATNTNNNHGRSRSSSRLRNGSGQREFHTSAAREAASKRSARERSRSRVRTHREEGEGKTKKSSRDRRPRSSENLVKSQNVRPEYEEVPLNDEITNLLQDPKTGDETDGYTSQVSLSLHSVFSETSDLSGDSFKPDKKKRPQKPKVKAYTEGEESFQVISSGANRNYAFGVKSRARSTSRDAATRASESHGAAERFVQTKKRLSRTKAAEMNAKRTSRKSDIFASLDREEGTDADIADVPRVSKIAPARTRSSDSRALVMRGPPLRSKSHAPKIDISVGTTQTGKTGEGGESEIGEQPVPTWPSMEESNDRKVADFEQSFSVMELLEQY